MIINYENVRRKRFKIVRAIVRIKDLKRIVQENTPFLRKMKNFVNLIGKKNHDKISNACFLIEIP